MSRLGTSMNNDANTGIYVNVIFGCLFFFLTFDFVVLQIITIQFSK